MHTLIQQLSDQAKNEVPRGILSPDLWIEEYNQKFAELIIRECIKQGKEIQYQTVLNGSEDYIAGREMGIEVFINQINQHFGVN